MTHLERRHDPERVPDSRHVLCLFQSLGRQAAVARLQHRAINIKEYGAVLVQQERLSDHRADERPDAVAEVQGLQHTNYSNQCTGGSIL